MLSLVDNPEGKRKYPTKQEPTITGQPVIKIRTGSFKPKYTLITIDDIFSFSKVKKINSPTNINFDKLPEEEIKEGFRKILRQEGRFKDWGGEINDLYTGKLKIAKSRKAAAFAFKGKATKGKLVPRKMGKNGDQIQRLFLSPAEVFFVVYPREIDQSIVAQMAACAAAKALSGTTVYYCVIGGDDFTRLYQAYSDKFH